MSEESEVNTELTPEQQREEVLRNLPTFEDTVIKILAERDINKYAMIRNDVFFYACFEKLTLLRIRLIEIGKEAVNFKFESNEFTDVQREFFHIQRILNAIRAVIFHTYQIPALDWTRIMPERYYCGVCLCEEDFKTFLTHAKSLREMGMVVQQVETPETELKKMAEADMKRGERVLEVEKNRNREELD